jgi:hypothetical protein
MSVASILWKRLDRLGHDACTIARRDTGWRLCGSAVFRQGGAPARLAYKVVCDAAWRTRYGQVEGSLGDRPVAYRVARTNAGGWQLNGVTVANLESCVDLDLGFTPATNLLALRRLDLAENQAADAPAAWLDVSAGTLALLPQRYARRTKATYWYEAPTVQYAALLEVAPTGFVLRYPGLWEAEG